MIGYLSEWERSSSGIRNVISCYKVMFSNNTVAPNVIRCILTDVECIKKLASSYNSYSVADRCIR